MTNVIIIHGAYGHPAENWFPYLKDELEKLGHHVYVPKLPTPEGQTLDNWLMIFKEYEKYLDEESIVVGHSLGPAFLLSIIERKRIKAAFFVAASISPLNNPTFDALNKTFLNRAFDWGKIRDNCKKFYLYYSDNDPYVPPVKAFELGVLLGAKPILVKNAGHFNENAGYIKFELLLNDIKAELSKQ